MRTPEGLLQANVPSTCSGTLPTPLAEVASSASPLLCKNPGNGHQMKRTPQPTLTQSKLTSMFQGRSTSEAGAPQENGPPAAPRMVTLDTIEMDTSSSSNSSSATAVGPAPTASNMPITADFLLKALKENSDHLMKSFNASLSALSTRIEENTMQIASNTGAIADNAAGLDNHARIIKNLTDRVAKLENEGQVTGTPTEQRATLSPSYQAARRSIRLWPIQGDTEDAIWQGVGDFLHETLAMGEDEIGQEDIESIARPVGGRDLVDRREVIVKFYDKQKRDRVVLSSPSLASKIDREGRPTAGIRLEVPRELDDTFRLLHRFGTRLRARHGVGTKRHIKFDDFSGSLFANIKLPGDTAWTKITPAMAREDLGASLREENAHTQKRLAAKLVPGPRERLQRPPLDTNANGPLRSMTSRGPPQASADPPVAAPAGKRPRWSMPDRGRQL